MNKYYDWTHNRIISESDGCKYEDWKDKSDKFPFCIHPEGFKIFLSPKALENNDEYLETDPYTVETNIDSEFHKRRINSTIYLLNLALGKKYSTRKY